MQLLTLILLIFMGTELTQVGLSLYHFSTLFPPTPPEKKADPVIGCS